MSVSAGQADAFDGMVRTEREAMVRLAALLTGSPASAEDIVQDALGKVAERWDGLDRPGAYLRKVVVNSCHGLRRRERVRSRLEPPRWVLPVDAPHELIFLRDAMRRLTERQRTIVVLRYFLDLPDDEIAELVGCTKSTVRSLNRRALLRLRKELAP